jgi:hypothetical protein
MQNLATIIYAPAGDEAFRLAVVSAFPFNPVQVDDTLPPEHIRLGDGGTVLAPGQHGVRKPTQTVP